MMKLQLLIALTACVDVAFDFNLNEQSANSVTHVSPDIRTQYGWQ